MHIFAAGVMVPEAVAAEPRARGDGRATPTCSWSPAPICCYRGLRDHAARTYSRSGVRGRGGRAGGVGARRPLPRAGLPGRRARRAADRRSAWITSASRARAAISTATTASTPPRSRSPRTVYLPGERLRGNIPAIPVPLPHALQRRSPPMDTRLRNLAEQLDAGLIARREFLRKAAVITGGTAAGLHALREHGAAPRRRPSCASGSSRASSPRATTCSPSRSRRGRRSKNVEVEMDWATFGDREQKFVAAIEAGNPPDIAEMNIYGPMRYKAALRDVSKLASDIAAAQGRPAALRRARHEVRRQVPRRRPLLDDHRVLHPQGHHGGQGPQAAQGLRSRRGRVRQEDPGPVQGPLGLRPDAEPLGRRRRLHAQHPLGLRRGRLGQGRQARARHDLPQAEHWRRCSSRWTPSRSTRSSRPASWAGPTCPTTRPTWRASS